MRNFTDITVLLDRSGSMSSVTDATIDGFNEFVSGQKAAGSNACLSLVQFDDQYEPNYEEVAITLVQPLNRDTYQPRGMTALHDALGKTIVRTGERLRAIPEHDRPDKVIFVIQTDGLENNSKEYTDEAVKKMVRHQEDVYNWEFVFIGANQDAVLTGAQLGVKSGSSLSYGHTDHGTQSAFRSVSNKTRLYRSMDSVALNALKSGETEFFDEEDRKEQENALQELADQAQELDMGY